MVVVSSSFFALRRYRSSFIRRKPSAPPRPACGSAGAAPPPPLQVWPPHHSIPLRSRRAGGASGGGGPLPHLLPAWRGGGGRGVAREATGTAREEPTKRSQRRRMLPHSARARPPGAPLGKHEVVGNRRVNSHLGLPPEAARGAPAAQGAQAGVARAVAQVAAVGAAPVGVRVRLAASGGNDGERPRGFSAVAGRRASSGVQRAGGRRRGAGSAVFPPRAHLVDVFPVALPQAVAAELARGGLALGARGDHPGRLRPGARRIIRRGTRRPDARRGGRGALGSAPGRRAGAEGPPARLLAALVARGAVLRVHEADLVPVEPGPLCAGALLLLGGLAPPAALRLALPRRHEGAEVGLVLARVPGGGAESGAREARRG